jgi:hypothetical protein
MKVCSYTGNKFNSSMSLKSPLTELQQSNQHIQAECYVAMTALKLQELLVLTVMMSSRHNCTVPNYYIKISVEEMSFRCHNC